MSRINAAGMRTERFLRALRGKGLGPDGVSSGLVSGVRLLEETTCDTPRPISNCARDSTSYTESPHPHYTVMSGKVSQDKTFPRCLLFSSIF